MRIAKQYFSLITLNAAVLSLFLVFAICGSDVLSVLYESSRLPSRKCVIIDAGHGGEDGGTTSCTGILESSINLEISLRLNDLMCLLGLETKMIRTSDRSIYTQGNTIAEKKISDLKERVRIANETPNGIVVSIHQNYYHEDQYKGAQVFYGKQSESMKLANIMQENLVRFLNPSNNRKAKRADGVYLMDQIENTGILIECGFLSNREEEALLRSESYQKKLCAVIASTCSQFLYNGRNAIS